MPGELARVTVALSNNSKGPMTTLRVRLRRHVELHARGAVEHINDDMSAADQNVNLQPGAAYNGSITLPIPAGIQNTLHGRIVKCTYSVVCQGVTDGRLDSSCPVCG